MVPRLFQNGAVAIYICICMYVCIYIHIVILSIISRNGATYFCRLPGEYVGINRSNPMENVHFSSLSTIAFFAHEKHKTNDVHKKGKHTNKTSRHSSEITLP